MCRPASAASCLPTAVEPVNEILRISGWAIRYSEIWAGTPKTRLIDAIGNAGIGEGGDQRHDAGGGLFRGLDDDRATGGKCCGNLAHRLVQREVPRREGCDRADRLADDQLLHVGGAGRDDAAIVAATFLGQPVDDVGAGERFDGGFGERLALLDGQIADDLLRAAAHEFRSLAHDLVTLERRDIAPDLEAGNGSGNCFLEVCFGCDRYLTDYFFRGRVDDRQGGAVAGAAPHTGDEHLGSGIGHVLLQIFHSIMVGSGQSRSR